MFDDSKRRRQHQSQLPPSIERSHPIVGRQGEMAFQDTVRTVLLSRSQSGLKTRTSSLVRRRSDTVPPWDDLTEERELSRRISLSSLSSVAMASVASSAASQCKRQHQNHTLEADQAESRSLSPLHIGPERPSSPAGSTRTIGSIKTISRKTSASILRFLGTAMGKRSTQSNGNSPPSSPISRVDTLKLQDRSMNGHLQQRQSQSSHRRLSSQSSVALPQGTPPAATHSQTSTLTLSLNPVVFSSGPSQRILSVAALDTIDAEPRAASNLQPTRSPPASPAFISTFSPTSPTPPGSSRRSCSTASLSNHTEEWEPDSPCPIEDEDSNYYNMAEARKLSPPPTSITRLNFGGRRGIASTRPAEDPPHDSSTQY